MKDENFNLQTTIDIPSSSRRKRVGKEKIEIEKASTGSVRNNKPTSDT